MPMINCYVTDETLAQLERVSKELGRSVEELAESAIEEAAIQSKRDFPAPGAQT